MHIAHNEQVVCTSRGAVFKIYPQSDLTTHIYSKKFGHTISLLRCQKDFVLIGLFNGDLFILDLETTEATLLYKLSTRITSVANHGCFHYVSSEEGEVVCLYVRTDEDVNPQQELSTSVFYDELTTEELTSVFDHTSKNPGSWLNDDSYLPDTQNLTPSEDTSQFLEQKSKGKKFYAALIRKFTHASPIVSLSTDGEKIYLLDMRGKVTQYPENIAYDISGTCMDFKRYLFVSEGNRIFCMTKDAFACFLECEKGVKSFWFSDNGGIVIVKHADALTIYNNSLEQINQFEIEIERFIFDESRNRIVSYDGFRMDIFDNIISNAQYLSSKIAEIVFSKSDIITKHVVSKDESEQPTKFIDFGHSHNLINLGGVKSGVQFTNDKKDAKIPKIYGQDSDVDTHKPVEFKKSAAYPIKSTLIAINEDSASPKTSGGVKTWNEKKITGQETIKARTSRDYDPKPREQGDISAWEKTPADKFFGDSSESTKIELTKKHKKRRTKSKFIDDAADDASSNEDESSFEDNQENCFEGYLPNPEGLYDNVQTVEKDFSEEESAPDLVRTRPRHTSAHQKPFMCGSLKTPEAKLFCYNKYGYIIQFTDTIEVIFHNSGNPLKTYNEVFNIGTIHQDFCVFADYCKLYFYGNTDWDVEIENIDLIAANDTYVICCTKTETRFYSHSGKFVASIRINDPVTIAVSDSKCAIRSQEKTVVIDRFFETRTYNSDLNITFMALEDDFIYYGIEGNLYLQKNDLVFFVSKIIHTPLCVNHNHLISVKSKLFPAPLVEFTKISTGNDISDAFLAADVQEALMKLLKSSTADITRDHINALLGKSGNFVEYNEIPHFRSKGTLGSSFNLDKHGSSPSISDHYTLYQDIAKIEQDPSFNPIFKKDCIFDSHLAKHKKTSGKDQSTIAESFEMEDHQRLEKENLDSNINMTPQKTIRFNPFAKKK